MILPLSTETSAGRIFIAIIMSLHCALENSLKTDPDRFYDPILEGGYWKTDCLTKKAVEMW